MGKKADALRIELERTKAELKLLQDAAADVIYRFGLDGPPTRTNWRFDLSVTRQMRDILMAQGAMGTPLAAAGLGTRVVTVLNGMGVYTVETLRRVNLNNAPGIGPVSLVQIRKALEGSDG